MSIVAKSTPTTSINTMNRLFFLMNLVDIVKLCLKMIDFFLWHWNPYWIYGCLYFFLSGLAPSYWLWWLEIFLFSLSIFSLVLWLEWTNIERRLSRPKWRLLLSSSQSFQRVTAPVISFSSLLGLHLVAPQVLGLQLYGLFWVIFSFVIELNSLCYSCLLVKLIGQPSKFIQISQHHKYRHCFYR